MNRNWNIVNWSCRQWCLFLFFLAGFILVPLLFDATSINNALLWLTGVVVLFYTIETHGLRLEMVRQNEIAIQPVIIAITEERPVSDARTRQQLILRNVGRGTALFAKIQDLTLTDPLGDRVRFVASFASLNYLEPHQEAVVSVAECRSIGPNIPGDRFDAVVSLAPPYAVADYKVVIEYSDTNGGAKETLMQIGKGGIRLLRHGRRL